MNRKVLELLSTWAGYPVKPSDAPAILSMVFEEREFLVSRLYYISRELRNTIDVIGTVEPIKPKRKRR